MHPDTIIASQFWKSVRSWHESAWWYGDLPEPENWNHGRRWRQVALHHVRHENPWPVKRRYHLRISTVAHTTRFRAVEHIPKLSTRQERHR